ncbi:MAG: GAF domain-containing sensor histidine kinase [Phycisphaerales bacterium]
MPSPITATPRPPDPAWYATAMESLVRVVQELSQAHTVDEVTAIVRQAARHLTGADGATFVLREGDQCYYADEDAIAPLWKGKRFPMSACVSGWVMHNRCSTTIEDVLADPRVPADAYRPTFVKSMAMVPIRRNEPIGAIGTYWATCRQPAAEEVALLQALADATSVAIQNADLYGKLYEQVRALERQKDHIRQQRDSIDIFARALAHDLKEPVRTLKSYSRLASDCSVQPEDQSEYLRFIQSAADRMGLLVDSVLRYMELESDSHTAPALCDVRQAAETVRQNLGQLINERIATLDIGSLPTIQAQPNHLVQLLQNLVSNAIRHNDRGVVVRVTACQTDQGWVFSVADNGRGVPPEQAATIFRPFKRLARNDDCAGLGLAICEKIVTRYGGMIVCRPNAGGGACFDFTLPNSGTTESQVRRTATEAETQPAHEDEPLACLLLVDDMPADLRLSQVMLAQGQAEVPGPHRGGW